MAKKNAATVNPEDTAVNTKSGAAPDVPQTETAQGKAPEKPAPTPKVKQPNQNGVTMPKAGTQTRRIWDVSDELTSSTGKTAVRGAVMEICEKEGLNKATIATQYGRWCKYHGYTKVTKAAEISTPEAPAA